MYDNIFDREKLEEALKTLEIVLREDQGPAKYREVMSTCVQLPDIGDLSTKRFNYFFFVDGSFKKRIVSVDDKFYALEAGTYANGTYTKLSDKSGYTGVLDLSYMTRYKKAMESFELDLEFAFESLYDYKDALEALVTPGKEDYCSYFYSEEHQKILKAGVDFNVMKKLAKHYLTIAHENASAKRVDSLAKLMTEHQKKYHSDGSSINDPSFELFYVETHLDNTWALRDESNGEVIYFWSIG